MLHNGITDVIVVKTPDDVHPGVCRVRFSRTEVQTVDLVCLTCQKTTCDHVKELHIEMGCRPETMDECVATFKVEYDMPEKKRNHYTQYFRKAYGTEKIPLIKKGTCCG